MMGGMRNGLHSLAMLAQPHTAALGAANKAARNEPSAWIPDGPRPRTCSTIARYLGAVEHAQRATDLPAIGLLGPARHSCLRRSRQGSSRQR